MVRKRVALNRFVPALEAGLKAVITVIKRESFPREFWLADYELNIAFIPGTVPALAAIGLEAINIDPQRLTGLTVQTLRPEQGRTKPSPAVL